MVKRREIKYSPKTNGNRLCSCDCSALQEFQTGVAVPSTSPPNQIYSDLAYGSLMDSQSLFESLFPVGNPNRQKIINRYTCESQGTPYGEGTQQGQSPVGLPCN